MQVTRHDKCAYFTLIGDFRHGKENFYCTSFKLKTLLPEQCLYIQKIAAQVEDILAERRPNLLDADLLQTLRRRLNEPVDSGLVRHVELRKKVFYEKISNPFGELSAEEIQTLTVALTFCRNVTLLGTAGYFLCDSLKSLYA